MNQAKRFGWLLILAVSAVLPVMAHVDIAANGIIGQAEFTEGKRIVLDIVLGDSCSTTDTNNYKLTYPTLAASVILPTKTLPLVKSGKLSGTTVQNATITPYSDEFNAEAPVLSLIKPFTDPLWQTVQSQLGDSLNDQEVFNVQWMGGFVDDDKVASLKLTATLATFKSTSCIKQARVYLPTVQYCANGFSLESINASGVVADTLAQNTSPNLAYANAPFFTIKRDLNLNILPTSGCEGTDDTLFIYPSSASIAERKLGGKMAWTAKLAKTKLGTSGLARAKTKWVQKSSIQPVTHNCPVGQHWYPPHAMCMPD